MEGNIIIRRSEPIDLGRIMAVYEEAKSYMRSKGNSNQWTGNYPDEEIILDDISECNHYIAEDEEGTVFMVFTFIIGEDPTYSDIENGEWLNEKPYGTLHRVASSGIKSGMMECCISYCSKMIDNIRIDTHADNGPMQQALQRLGFSCCGIIHLKDGSPRLAFQKDYRKEIVMDIRF